MLKLRKRDIAGGRILFGERIQFVSILRDLEMPDIERTAQIIECLHGFRPIKPIAFLLQGLAYHYTEDMVNWMKREAEECNVAPQQEAIEAGAEHLSKVLGDTGSVVALADRRNYSFEQVYNMPYLEVFSIWKYDVEMTKFQRELNKRLEAKARSKK